jgi:hypothetical protein
VLAVEGTGDHDERCTATQCQFAEKGEDYDGFKAIKIYGQEFVLNGCPRAHLLGRNVTRRAKKANGVVEVSYALADGTSKDDGPMKWIRLYRWLNEWKTTPMQMGVPVDRVDPVFFEAMELISDTYALQTEKE